MTDQETADLMIKIIAIAGAVYLLYMFIKDRYGKK
jgi:threonine/homoserine/homoserine lactone efflux protein